MHITEKYNCRNIGHRGIDFVDVNFEIDNLLFIDPILIELSSNDWCKKVAERIKDYFECVIESCTEKDYDKLDVLLSNSKENNETRLGMSAGKSRGKGASKKILTPILESLSRELLFKKGIITDINDLMLFATNFSNDRMSDLITNIIKKDLYEFTVKQCEQFSISLSREEENLGKYWCQKKHCWEIFRGKSLKINGEGILLVPKFIVRHGMVITAEKYLGSQFLEYRQKEHLENDTEHVRKVYKKSQKKYEKRPPTKKTLRELEIKGKDRKKLLQTFSCDYPDQLQLFKSRYNMKNISEFILSNEELDAIIYKDNIAINI